VRLLFGFAVLVPIIPALFAEPRPWVVAQPSFRRLARTSGLIFSGTVLSVQQANIAPGSSRKGDAVATTRITFRMEQAIRGVPRGKSPASISGAGCGRAGNVTGLENVRCCSCIRRVD